MRVGLTRGWTRNSLASDSIHSPAPVRLADTHRMPTGDAILNRL
jgi:hypothetical protein